MIQSSVIYRNTKRLNNDITAMDVAMECAYFIEQIGALGFKNWSNGELVAGPYITKYFTTISLMFPATAPPDLLVLDRLKSMQCKFSHERDQYKRVVFYRESPDSEYLQKIMKHDVWVLTLKIPNRYLALDGNTLFNIDDQDINYDDLEVIYNKDVSASPDDNTNNDNNDNNDFGGFDDTDLEV